MEPRRWEEIQSTFDTLVELGDVERGNRLTALSDSDPELRAAVESLLAADSDADARLAPLEAVFFPKPVAEPDPLGLAGQTVSHFQIHESIGAGGMGVVYRAEDTRLGRAVALKFLLPSHSLDAGAKARFLREAHLVAALDHPNLCTIYEVGTSDDGGIFLAMALYPGETLKARNGPMPVSEALVIARQVAEGLECAHRAGIVHRDLKPGNVMLLPDGTVKILDFGLAKARDQSLSEPGARFGTVSYMSPEQIRGEAVDGRADLWALGVVLYEMLTARKPFGGEQDIAIAHAILHDEPAPFSTHRRDVTPALEDLVLRLLEKDPARRYATASELLDDLAQVETASERTIASLRTRRWRTGRKADGYANAGDFARALATPGAPERRPTRSRRWVPVAIGGAVAAAAAIAAALILARKPAPRPQLDRVQLTVTGNAMAPSLSPDGARVAFAEKQCDEGGGCTYQLVIEDIDGSGRLVLTRNIAIVMQTSWTADGRYLVYRGSYGSSRSGTFTISTLGGVPEQIGCCAFALLGGDTVFSVPLPAQGDSIAWVKRVTAHDGQTLDSIPVRNPGVFINVTPVSFNDRVLVAVQSTFVSAPELRLIDLRGAVIDRATHGFGGKNRQYVGRWLPSRNEFLVAAETTPQGGEYDFLRIRVTPSDIDSEVDTVLSGIHLRNVVYDVSRDGERVVFATGAVETTVWAVDLNGKSGKDFTSNQVLTSTTSLRGRISPGGDKIFLAREISTGARGKSQLFIVPWKGGAESEVAASVKDLLDWEWTLDGERLVYLHGSGAGQARLMEVDTAGRRNREIARVDRSAVSGFQTMRNGAIALLSGDRRAISVTRRLGQPDVTLRAPAWIGWIASFYASPDGNSLAIEASDRDFDSVVVATLNINTRVFKRLGIFGGEETGTITWLDDGRIMFTYRETRGAYALFTIVPGRPVERIGSFPHARASFSIAKGGRHMTAFSYSDKSDVHMIRNLGEMLRR